MFENHGITDSQENICNSSCFSIMADECSDVSNKEQFTICIRWVSSGGFNSQESQKFWTGPPPPL